MVKQLKTILGELNEEENRGMESVEVNEEGKKELEEERGMRDENRFRQKDGVEKDKGK